MDVYQEAVNKFGKKSQLFKAIEELAELTCELSKSLAGFDNSKLVCGEIADVEIMLTQLRLIFDPKEIEVQKRIKLERLKDMLGPYHAIPPQRTG